MTNKFCTKSKTNNSPIKKDRTEKTIIFPLSNFKIAIKKTTAERSGAKKSHTKVTIKLFFKNFEASEKTRNKTPAKIPKQTKTIAWKNVPENVTI